MAIVIKEVTTQSELKEFVNYPLTLYRNHPCYVPNLFDDDMHTLRRDTNAAFEYADARYWLAYKDGRLAGRIAGIINRRAIEKWQSPYVRFSWFDFEDDIEISRALLAVVEAWGQENGLSAIHGPLGFTDLDREGMLVEGFEELGTMATFYNYAYYPAHMEQLGYSKDIDWLEYEVDVPAEVPEKISRLAEIVLKRNNLHVMQFKRKKEMLAYAGQLFGLLNDEYKNLYGMVALNERQIEAYTQQYFGLVNQDFVPMIADEHDRLVAFGVALPSLSHALQKSRGKLFPFGFLHLLKALRWNNRGDLYLVAIRSEYQGMGLNAVLINLIIRVFNRMGITRVESNPELETNLKMRTQWKHFDVRQHKRRRIFIKNLAAK